VLAETPLHNGKTVRISSIQLILVVQIQSSLLKESDKKGLKKFREEFPHSHLYMLTKDELEREEEINLIPLWMFLLHI